MPQIDIYKLNNALSIVEIAKSADISEFEFSEMLMGHARLLKRDTESAGAAFERILMGPTPEGAALRQVYRKVKGYPGRASLEVVTEVGDSREDGEADALKAAGQIAALVAEQRSRAPTLSTSALYDAVYRDPANKALLARAHKRPDASSPSAAALQGEGKW
jgi:hypothetical protein